MVLQQSRCAAGWATGRGAARAQPLCQLVAGAGQACRACLCLCLCILSAGSHTRGSLFPPPPQTKLEAGVVTLIPEGQEIGNVTVREVQGSRSGAGGCHARCTRIDVSREHCRMAGRV